eukprot:2297517-Rhodomonas_salina.2
MDGRSKDIGLTISSSWYSRTHRERFGLIRPSPEKINRKGGPKISPIQGRAWNADLKPSVCRPHKPHFASARWFPTRLYGRTPNANQEQGRHTAESMSIFAGTQSMTMPPTRALCWGDIWCNVCANVAAPCQQHSSEPSKPSQNHCAS